MRSKRYEKIQDVDLRLESPGQLQAREAVRSLPEESLSLAWRSEMNTRLRAEIGRKKRIDLLGWVWKPAAGVALASVVALAFFARLPNPGAAPTAGVERALVNNYVDSTAAWEVAGDNATLNDAKEAANAHGGQLDWDQEDVGATL